MTLIATASQGWEFTGWTGDLGGISNPGTITMDANKVVTANFSELAKVYTLSANCTGQGSINPSGGSYNENTSIQLTAIPDSGWGIPSLCIF